MHSALHAYYDTKILIQQELHRLKISHISGYNEHHKNQYENKIIF